MEARWVPDKVLMENFLLNDESKNIWENTKKLTRPCSCDKSHP